MSSSSAPRAGPAGAFLPVIAVLAALTILTKYGPRHGDLVLGPLAAVVLVGLGRRVGLSWDQLGLDPRSWSRGAAVGGAAFAPVAVVYVAGAALPQTRSVFLDARYRLRPGPALLTALVAVPIRTVLVEEVAFRGVLLGLLRRRRGAAWASALSSALFGLWHILPSWQLNVANRAVAAAAGPRPFARAGVVTATVASTALAGLGFCELRRRSGSLLASGGLHWATNGLAVLLAAAVWKLPRS